MTKVEMEYVRRDCERSGEREQKKDGHGHRLVRQQGGKELDDNGRGPRTNIKAGLGKPRRTI